MPEVVELVQGAAFGIGERVRIEGLQARPELNGRYGKIKSYETTKARYAVDVDGAKGPMLLKLCNLKIAGDATDSADAMGAATATGPMSVSGPGGAGGDASVYTVNLVGGADSERSRDAHNAEQEDNTDYDYVLADADFDALREHLLRASSRPGCAPMPGRRLSGIDGRRSTIVRAIVEIVDGGTGSESALLRAACDALSKICTAGPAARAAVRRAHAAEALVRLIREASAEAVEKAPTAEVPSSLLRSCHALTNLANGDLACKQAVARADGARVFVGAIDRAIARAAGEAAGDGAGEASYGMTGGVADEYVGLAKLCAGGLANVGAGDDECVRAVLGAGGVRVVVLSLRRWGGVHAPLASDGCLCLANLSAAKGEAAEAVVDGGGLGVIAAVVRAHTAAVHTTATTTRGATTRGATTRGATRRGATTRGPAPAMARESATAREWAAAALANLSSSGSAEVREALIESHAALQAAVSVLIHAPLEEAHAARYAVAVWAHLGKTSDGSDAAVHAGFVEATLQRMLDAADAAADAVDSASATANATANAAADAAADAAAADAAAAAAASVPFVEEACRALATLAFAGEHGRDTLRRAGALKALTLVVERYPTEPNVQQMGRYLLSQIA